MKTINQEEPIARSRFIDCPSCKTRTLKLKKIVHSGRCKTCHESYKIVIIYVKEGKKPKPADKTASPTTVPSPEPTLPSWQVPSDSSLFGTLPSESEPLSSDYSSIFGSEEKSDEASTSNGQ